MTKTALERFQMAKSFSPLDVEQDRRAFLGKAAGVLVPPAMVMLLSTSLVSPAIAASGGGARGTTGEGSNDGSPLGPLFGAGAVGGAASSAAAASSAGVAIPPVAAAASAAVPAAADASMYGASASSTSPVAATPAAASPHRARAVAPAAAPGRTPTATGGGRGQDQRSLAIRRAGERG